MDLCLYILYHARQWAPESIVSATKRAEDGVKNTFIKFNILHLNALFKCCRSMRFGTPS